MKRYIIVALLALVCSTSCLLDDGSEPDVNRPYKVIYENKAGMPVYLAQTYAWYFIVADTFLYGNEEESSLLRAVL